MAIELLQAEAHVVQVPIEAFISLADAGIPGGDLAVRELDERHIQDLVNSDNSTWPALKAANANVGLILVDGYHRREAGRRKGEATIATLVQPYATIQDVIEAAFRANLAHGLKASDENRGDYVFWLHITYPEMSQEDIARRSGMSQPAVSKAIAKREALLRDAALEEMGVKQQFDTERACKQFSKRVIKFVGEVEMMSDEDLLKYMQSTVKQEDRAKLARVGQLLLDAYGQKTKLRQFV